MKQTKFTVRDELEFGIVIELFALVPDRECCHRRFAIEVVRLDS